MPNEATIKRKEIALAKRAGEGLLNLIFPPHCVACGQMGAWFCQECLQALPERAIFAADNWWGEQGGLTTLRSVAFHEFPFREAVYGLKYGGMRILADPLAEVMVSRWRQAPAPMDIVIPVPLHPARRRQRGYNQAQLLAKAFCDRTDLSLVERTLIRRRDTPSQVGRSRAERQRNMRGAFACTQNGLEGRSILLIDDVCTTGATLAACAEVLLRAGAKKVHAFTLTRAR